eukprot:scaffold308379_cov37-Attheya_sp.AAC.5
MQPPTKVKSANRNRTKKHYHKRQKIHKQELNESYLASLDWTRVKDEFRTGDWGLFEKLIDENEVDGLVEYMHPMVLQIKASSQDNFRWHEAMNKELETLEVKQESWDIEDRTDEIIVLKSTWGMNIKRFPNGLINKFKARFYVQGDMQIEGVDFFDTYAPVMQWSTIRLIMIIALLLNLTNAQADVTAAFLHTPLDGGDEIFVDMPMGLNSQAKCTS